MQPVSIGSATAQDSADCAGLLTEHLREHNIQISAESLRDVLDRIIADEQCGFVQVARAKDQIVGVAYVAAILSVEHAGPVAWLEELYVPPAWRQNGIGSALIAAVLERAQARGMVAVDLEIDVGHHRAASLYERNGFHRLERSRWARKLTRTDEFTAR